MGPAALAGNHEQGSEPWAVMHPGCPGGQEEDVESHGGLVGAWCGAQNGDVWRGPRQRECAYQRVGCESRGPSQQSLQVRRTIFPGERKEASQVPACEVWAGLVGSRQQGPFCVAVVAATHWLHLVSWAGFLRRCCWKGLV